MRASYRNPTLHLQGWEGEAGGEGPSKHKGSSHVEGQLDFESCALLFNCWGRSGRGAGALEMDKRRQELVDSRLLPWGARRVGLKGTCSPLRGLWPPNSQALLAWAVSSISSAHWTEGGGQ